MASASELLSKEGLGALNVRAIARNANLSTIAIYRHFQGKQDVLDALCIEGFERLRAAARRIDRDGDPVTMVVESTKSYLEVADQFPAHYQLMFEAASMGYKPSASAKQASLEAFEELVFHVGRVQHVTVEPRVLAMDLWALMHGHVALTKLSPGRRRPRRERIELIADAVAAHIKGRQTAAAAE